MNCNFSIVRNHCFVLITLEKLPKMKINQLFNIPLICIIRQPDTCHLTTLNFKALLHFKWPLKCIENHDLSLVHFPQTTSRAHSLTLCRPHALNGLTIKQTICSTLVKRFSPEASSMFCFLFDEFFTRCVLHPLRVESTGKTASEKTLSAYNRLTLVSSLFCCSCRLICFVCLCSLTFRFFLSLYFDKFVFKFTVNRT